jgi:NAD(P)-dependent dehydrogenase (short-subunit alcohol dehydrogenase family)
VSLPTSGRVAVVTGASRGLGAGLAEYFARAGMHLGLCARHRPGPLHHYSPPATSSGQDPVPREPLRAAVDVTDRAAVENFADAVVERFGHIDLWVNNAGLLGPIGPLAGLDATAVAEVVDVNVVGVLNGSAVFARHVRSRTGSGVLVNISSGAGAKPYEGWAAYCASKAAVDMVTRVVVLEEAAHGLEAYALAPGVVDTDMQAAIRATDAASFPAVEQFRQIAEDDRFNSPAWVGEYIVGLAFGSGRSDQVVQRVPAQPVSGLAG